MSPRALTPALPRNAAKPGAPVAQRRKRRAKRREQGMQRGIRPESSADLKTVAISATKTKTAEEHRPEGTPRRIPARSDRRGRDRRRRGAACALASGTCRASAERAPRTHSFG